MMYILTEEEYKQLKSNTGNSNQVEAFVGNFAFFQCVECGRLVAMQKSKKDSADDIKTLALGCPGCGENVELFAGKTVDLINKVLS